MFESHAVDELIRSGAQVDVEERLSGRLTEFWRAALGRWISGSGWNARRGAVSGNHAAGGRDGLRCGEGRVGTEL